MSTGIHDGVSKVWVLRRDHGLDVDGYRNDVEAIDRLIRHALTAGVPRSDIEAAVAHALRHLDEDEPDERDSVP